MSATTTHTELAQRQNDGIEVTLLWSRNDGSVAVHVRHLRTSKTFELAVEPDRALDAYHHPFSYTQRRSRQLVEAAA